MSKAIVSGLLLVLAAGMYGCSTIEYSRSPVLPDVRVSDTPIANQPAVPMPEAAPANTPEAAPAAGPAPLELSIESAVGMALKNNKSLQVQLITPELAATRIAEARSQFDPVVSSTLTHSRQEADRDVTGTFAVPTTTLGGVTVPANAGSMLVQGEAGATNTSDDFTAAIQQFFPTGTAVGLTLSDNWSDTNNYVSLPGTRNPTDTRDRGDAVQLSFTQQLLQGRGLKVNLATLRQAELAALASEYALRGFVEDLVAQVESTYWDYTLAQRKIAILEDSLALAERQMGEMQERIRVGTLAESELAAAEAEVAQRRSALIDGRSALDQLRLTLLRLLYPSQDAMKQQSIQPAAEPLAADVSLAPVEQAAAFAQRLRPELNQARLQLEQDDLELVKTKNGLLPQLELFVNLSHSGNRTFYSDAITSGADRLDDSALRTDVGARFSYPLGNRAGQARHQRARMSREQDEGALENLAQLVEQDVRGAYVEYERARAQVTATAATRRLQEVVAQTEAEKFRVGNSTALLVAQAQRDLLAAQINEAQAQATLRKSTVNVYRLEGSLLLRRGVDCPGMRPAGEEDNVVRPLSVKPVRSDS